MVDEEEWEWIVEHSRGAFDHLVLASTLPVFMPHGHPPPRGVERGALRRPLGAARRPAQREAPARRRPRALGRVQPVVRAAVQLAPGRRRGRGGAVDDRHPRRRRPQRLRERGRARRQPAASRVFQIVCSPFRNRLSPRERRIVQATGSRASGAVFSRLARLAGCPEPVGEVALRPATDVRELDRRARARRALRPRDPPPQPASRERTSSGSSRSTRPSSLSNREGLNNPRDRLCAQIQSRSRASTSDVAAIPTTAITTIQKSRRVGEDIELEVHVHAGDAGDQSPGRSRIDTSVSTFIISFVRCSVTHDQDVERARDRVPHVACRRKRGVELGSQLDEPLARALG